MPGLHPLPVSHVHLVEGLLGQQGLHQGPGHGGVICVVQCFCREEGGGVRIHGLQWNECLFLLVA